jgi:hypothetical protein
LGLEFNDIKDQETYFDMSKTPCVKDHRLDLFWKILGWCIEERKVFTFQCNNNEEADELSKLTYTLVFQFHDRWDVSLGDDLVIKATPPNTTT